jgi:hypothetical protein
MGNTFLVLSCLIVADVKKRPEGSGDLLSGFFRAAGEEIGWRCFLLPQLMEHYDKFTATLIW